MPHLTFFLTGGLGEADLQQIHHGALRVLDEIGVTCAHKGFQERLAGTEGILIEGDSIKFSPDLVDEYVARMRDHERASPPTDWTLSAPWTGLWLCDTDTNELRQATLSDTIEMVKLCDASGFTSGPPPVFATDVPPRLAPFAMDMACLRYSRGLGCGFEFSEDEDIKYLKELWQAAGRRCHILCQFLISPLHFNEASIDTILRYMDDPDLDVHPGLAIPMLGATAPLSFPGAMMQTAAEALAARITLSIVTNGRTAPFNIRLEPFDMKYANIVFGSPEWDIFSLLAKQVHEWYTHTKTYSSRLRTMSKTVDLQAQAERTASALFHALAGARHFGGAGQMSVDEVFSPVQVILDEEIVAYCRRVCEGAEFGDANDDFRLIAEVGPGGNYLAQDRTVESHRQVYWLPGLFEHWNVGQWREARMPTVLARAREEAKRRIASHEYECSDEARKGMERVYARVERALG